MLNVKNRPVLIPKSYGIEEYCFSCSNFDIATNMISITITCKLNEKGRLHEKCQHSD